jgi:hypothetical protein
MRHQTHCDEQLNGLATLADGLFKRTGTQHIKLLDLTGANGASVQGTDGAAHAHIIDQGPSSKHLLLLVNGNLMVYDLFTGTAESVAFPNGKTYLNSTDPETQFRCVSVADYTFVVNRSKVVATKAATDPANPTNVAYINVRTAVPSIDYKITIDSVTVTVSTGTSPNNKQIAADFVTALGTALGAGYTVTQLTGANIVKVVKGSGTITCKVTDGWGNNCLQSITDGVQKFTDLPAVFETGYTVSITGTADSSKDTYYVKWDGVKWVETKKPTLVDTLDDTTMPHQLRPDGVGGWVFEKVPTWDTRKTGDDNTNPLPSFVGHTIQDAFFYRNRLGFLSVDGLAMSRAGEYFSFFSRTATQVLDSDPIDLGSPTAQVHTLAWAVVFNENLLVFSDSKQQFKLLGGDVLSPNNARLVPTTPFESYTGVRPEPLGNRVIFTANRGSFSQVSLYRVSSDTVTNVADDITEHCPRYVPGTPRQLAVSTVTKMVAVIPRGVATELAVFKYEANEQDTLTQRAWCKFQFTTPATMRVLKGHWEGARLYLLFHTDTPGDSVTGGRYVLEAFDFPTEGDEALGEPTALRLDGRAQVAFVSFDGTYSNLDVPYLIPSGLQLVRFEDGAEPVPLPIASYAINPGTGKTRITVLGDYTGARIYAGRPFKFRYVFTEVFMRDQSGVPMMAATVKLVRIKVRAVLTGFVKALVTPRLRDTYTYPFVGRTIGDPAQGAGMLSLSTGTIDIPVQTQAAGTVVAMESDSYLPCKFPYAEWVGDVTMKAQR